MICSLIICTVFFIIKVHGSRIQAEDVTTLVICNFWCSKPLCTFEYCCRSCSGCLILAAHHRDCGLILMTLCNIFGRWSAGASFSYGVFYCPLPIISLPLLHIHLLSQKDEFAMIHATESESARQTPG
jgi:hypothetical protein